MWEVFETTQQSEIRRQEAQSQADSNYTVDKIVTPSKKGQPKKDKKKKNTKSEKKPECPPDLKFQQPKREDDDDPEGEPQLA